jgi:hypothetical protein
MKLSAYVIRFIADLGVKHVFLVSGDGGMHLNDSLGRCSDTICVYHTQNHLWTIPFSIHKLVPEYRLFLRPHDSNGWDSVCYAIPERRSKLGGLSQ